MPAPWTTTTQAAGSAAPAAPTAGAAAIGRGSIAAPARLIPSLVRIPGLEEAKGTTSGKAPPRQGMPSRLPPPAEPTAGGGAPSQAHAANDAPSRANAPRDRRDVEADEATLRVVVVRRFFLPSEVPPPSELAARRAWVAEATDELWAEACKYGEVERIELLLDGDALSSTEGTAAIRFHSVLAAAAAVDALDGRFFAERSLAAAFDDGRASRVLPAGEDVRRQQRFGFGEIAEAYQESIKVLRLAAADGAPFISCNPFLVEVEHYDYHADGPHGAGYYRHENAPPPDPFEQARAVLVRASEAGAAFVACADPAGLRGLSEIPQLMGCYDYLEGPEGSGFYRRFDAPPPADPIEAARLVLREAAAASAPFVRCADFVGDFVGYDFVPDGHARALACEGGGYYRRPDAPPADPADYSRIVLQRASAAGADFVACPERVTELPGYEHRDGAEGLGYYRLGAAADHAPLAPTGPPPTTMTTTREQPQHSKPSASHSGGGAFDDFMSTMKQLGAV